MPSEKHYRARVGKIRSAFMAREIMPTGSAIAGQTGVPVSTINAILNKRRNVHGDTMAAIMAYLRDHPAPDESPDDLRVEDYFELIDDRAVAAAR